MARKKAGFCAIFLDVGSHTNAAIWGVKSLAKISEE